MMYRNGRWEKKKSAQKEKKKAEQETFLTNTLILRKALHFKSTNLVFISGSLHENEK
jgi:undecaprenyl pyrophosphate synthase